MLQSPRRRSWIFLTTIISLALAAPAGGPLEASKLPDGIVLRSSQPRIDARGISYRSPRDSKPPSLHDEEDLVPAGDVDGTAYSPSFDPVASHPPATSLQPDVPYTDSDPNDVLWTPTVYKGRITTDSTSPGPDGPADLRPEPKRGMMGAAILGPENVPIELQNADSLAPPSTDNGQVPNFKWPFSLSHNKLKKGGWARQQNG